MAEKRPLAGEEPPSAAAGTSSSNTSSSSGQTMGHQQGDVAVDVDRISAAGVSVTIPDDGDAEFRRHSLASAEVGEGARAAADGGGGSGSRSREAVGMSPMSVLSNWRWIGAKELHYLVTNRRPPPSSQPAPPADEQAAGRASSAGAATGATEREEEGKGAFVRVVTDGAADRQAPDGAGGGGGGEAGRQTAMAHILLPTTASADSTGRNSDVLHLSKDEELLLLAAAAVGRGGGKKGSMSGAIGDGDVEKGGRAGEGNPKGGDRDECGEDDENEALCRVCHMSTAGARKDEVLLDLGCACKMDMGRAHRNCAETWFQVRGNRKCEICGEIARNVVLVTGPGGDAASDDGQERSGAGSDATVTIVTVHRPILSVCWQDRPIRNFVLVFLVAAFLVPWLFRFVYYS